MSNSLRSSSSSRLPRRSSWLWTSIRSRHGFRQLKFILPGGAMTWYLDVHKLLWKAAEAGKWGRVATLTSLGLGLTTVVLFLYLLTIPWTRGVQPNYRSWRDSAELSSLIPVLTVIIVLGWALLSFTLAKFARVGYVVGIISASGLYALSFGLMGLLPVPQGRRD